MYTKGIRLYTVVYGVCVMYTKCIRYVSAVYDWYTIGIRCIRYVYDMYTAYMWYVYDTYTIRIRMYTVVYVFVILLPIMVTGFSYFNYKQVETHEILSIYPEHRFLIRINCLDFGGWENQLYFLIF